MLEIALVATTVSEHGTIPGRGNIYGVIAKKASKILR